MLEEIKNVSGPLEQSLFHLNSTQEQILQRLGVKDKETRLPGWFPQERISRALFHHSGVEYLFQVEKYHGKYLWAMEFSNVHTTFEMQEPVILIDGIKYPSVEAYFQSEKFVGLPHYLEALQKLQFSNPHEAFAVGRSYPLRPDWEHVKVEVMRKGVRAKFTQHLELKNILLSTGNHPLVQLKPSDDFWGTGKRGDGKNMLGVLLQQLRTEIRSENE